MAEYVKYDDVWNMLNDIGGCGADPESWANGWDKAIDTAIEELKEIPIADVRPERHGYWIKERKKVLPLKLMDLCICNICGCWYNQAIVAGIFKYCPNCGAKMDGDKNDRAKIN